MSFGTLVANVRNALNGIPKDLGLGGNGGSNSPSSVQKQGILLYEDDSITLGSISVKKRQSNIRLPNNFPLSNLYMYLEVTDTTGTSVPSGVNSIESVLQKVTLTASDGTPIASFDGTLGEIERWQHRLNDNGVYNVADTPADSAASTGYTGYFKVPMKHFVMSNADAQGMSISVQYNTLASRATTTNSMTSQVVKFQIFADAVPLSSFTPIRLRTKDITSQFDSTGYLDYGGDIDRTTIYDLSVDVSADTNLDTSDSWDLAVNGNTLIPSTSYTVLVSREDATYNSSGQHINGFFPLSGIGANGVVLDGTQAISLTANVSTAPTLTNLYMIEKR